MVLSVPARQSVHVDVQVTSVSPKLCFRAKGAVTVEVQQRLGAGCFSSPVAGRRLNNEESAVELNLSEGVRVVKVVATAADKPATLEVFTK